MQTTIRGYYEQGKIVLQEAPPVEKHTDVMVTFLIDEAPQNKTAFRKPSGLKGKVTIPDDFNAPLEDLK
ncbi:hypothetical protein [Parasediminibacterium sp. JCM 36343]|uniref:hypothetical protein n=1 Tax=Parasediminibacterium sp. JCM 36343 TaxID=3374279 RepID=UPI00397B1B84